MPQTREHLAICELLHVKRGFVALTKTDLVEDEWLKLVREDIADHLRGTFLEGSPIVPVSAKTGEGVEDIRRTLEVLAEHVPPKSPEGILRMPIDRVFIIRGFGTVVTGTLFAGRVKLDDRVEVYPKGHRARVRGIQVHDMPVETATAGQRTAINLPGIEKSDIERGDVLSQEGALRVTGLLDATFHLLSDLDRPLKHRSRVRFHLGTAEIMARLLLLDRTEVLPGQKAFVQIALEGPTVALAGDHYVVRSFSPITTTGGGTVLHPTAPRHRRREAGLIETLSALEGGLPLERVRIQLAASGASGLTGADVLFHANTSPAEARAISRELANSGEALDLTGNLELMVHAKAFAAAQRQVLEALESYHGEFPLKPGISREELRSKLIKLPDRVFSAALKDLQAEGKAVSERDQVRLSTHRIALGEEQQKLQEHIEEVYLAGGFQPPTLKELYAKLSLDTPAKRELPLVLMHEGRLVRIKDDVVFHRKHLDRIESLLKEYLSTHPNMTAAQFRDLLGISRKHTIPLIEYFDREGITLRIGDARVLRKKG